MDYGAPALANSPDPACAGRLEQHPRRVTYRFGLPPQGQRCRRPAQDGRDVNQLNLRELMAKENLDFHIVPSLRATDGGSAPLGTSLSADEVAIANRVRSFVGRLERQSLRSMQQTSSRTRDTGFRPRSNLTPTGRWSEPADRVNLGTGSSGDLPQHQAHEPRLEAGVSAAEPPRPHINLAWKDKSHKSREPLFTQPVNFAGEDVSSKLEWLRDWIRRQAPAVPGYSKAEPTASQKHVATLVTSLPAIAYLLNLRGSDVPFNPLFQGYLFVTLDNAFLFVDAVKVKD
uniref:Uncharacterized protein n=1 Tax=Mycena chlorophos TaxID=658473 RepID=A0ABQ0L8H3_MYCCL|nr:predicted protein [Mycena chlorophos]